MTQRLHQVKPSSTPCTSCCGARGARTSASASPTVAGWAQPARATYPTVTARSLPRDLKREAKPSSSVTIRRSQRLPVIPRRTSFPSSPTVGCIALYKRRTPALVFPLCLSHPDQESPTPIETRNLAKFEGCCWQFFDLLRQSERFARIRPAFPRNQLFLGSFEELCKGSMLRRSIL
jgi:hypothetical protein